MSFGPIPTSYLWRVNSPIDLGRVEYACWFGCRCRVNQRCSRSMTGGGQDDIIESVPILMATFCVNVRVLAPRGLY